MANEVYLYGFFFNFTLRNFNASEFFFFIQEKKKSNVEFVTHKKFNHFFMWLFMQRFLDVAKEKKENSYIYMAKRTNKPCRSGVCVRIKCADDTEISKR